VSKKDDFDLQDFLPYLLNQAAEASSLAFQETYKGRYGMLRNEWRVLFHLGIYGRMTARDIGQRARMHNTRISRAVAKLEARLGAAMLSLPAAKGFELGSGFTGADLRGSEHNDPFVPGGAETLPIVTETNRSGGVQGGISNGAPVWFRVAFKPVATHFQPQRTVTRRGEATTFRATGRHDSTVLPRAVVIVEAMTALTLADAWLRQRGQVGGFPKLPVAGG